MGIEAQAVGVWEEEVIPEEVEVTPEEVKVTPEEVKVTPEEKPYFEGDRSKLALEDVMEEYQMTVGSALKVPAEDVNVGNLFYSSNMKPIPHKSGDLPPHLKNRTTAAGAPHSTVIYQTISGHVKNDAGILVPQYTYFGQNSEMHKSVINKQKKHTLIKNNWLPTGGLNASKERLWSGIVVDNHGNLFRHTNKSQNEVTDIMHGWNAGLEDRMNWGIDTLKHIRGYSNLQSPIEFYEEDYAEDDMVIGGGARGKKVYNGAPYWVEKSWVGNVVVANQNRSHFRFKPNALGVMTEYDTPVGDMMAGATIANIARFTTDIIPTVLDVESRVFGTLYQLGAEQYYKFTSNLSWLNNKNIIKHVDGKPTPMLDANADAMRQHAFIWKQAEVAGTDMNKWEEENPWPKTPIFEISQTYSDLVVPFYSGNIIAELLTPDSKISDQLLGKYILPKSEIQSIVLGEHQAASVKYPQDMLAFMASYKFFDRVIGKLTGTGSPRGKKIWNISKKNAEDIFKNDPIRKNQNWKSTPLHVKEVYYKRGFLEYMAKKSPNKDFPNLTRWLDKGRVAAHLNMKFYDNVNMLVSNTMAVGGLYFSNIFAGAPSQQLFYTNDLKWSEEEGTWLNIRTPDYTETRQPIVPYILGSILLGLPVGGVVSGSRFQQGIMQQSWHPLQVSSYVKTPIKLVTTAMTGPKAIYDLLKSTVTRTGNTWSPLDLTINELARTIPDQIRGVDIDLSHKIKMAKFILASRNQAVETGKIESFMNEIEMGEQFIADLKYVLGAEGKGGAYGVEFAEKYQQALTDLDSLIGLKTVDNVVAETTNIGMSINPEVIAGAGKIVMQQRENAQNLIVVVDDLLKLSPQKEGEALGSISDHLHNMRAMARVDLDLSNERLVELRGVIQFNRELLTSEHYTGLLDNNRIMFRLLNAEVEIMEATGIDPKIIAKLIQDTREKANKNMIAVMKVMKDGSKEFSANDAAAQFVMLHVEHTDVMQKYASDLYTEAKRLLKVPAELQPVYTTLKESFFDVDLSEMTIRSADAKQLGNIIGDAVRTQYHGMLKSIHQTDTRKIAEITQEVAEIIGLKELNTLNDYLTFYRVFNSPSTQGIRLRDFLRSDGVAPQMVNPSDGFKLPGESLLNIHQMLMASHRSFADKKHPQYLAYEKSIKILHEEIRKSNPEALDTIVAVGKNYADNVHVSKSGEFNTQIASTTGIDGRGRSGFEKSLANPTGLRFDKLQPSKWLDKITNMIIGGEWERAASILNEKFGQIVTKSKTSIDDTTQNSLVDSQTLIDSGEFAGRKIVSERVAPMLAALIDWNLNQKLYHNPKWKKIIEKIDTPEGGYANIALEGTGIFGKKSKITGKDSAHIDFDDIQEILNNIELFNNEMKLTEGTFFEVLDPVNLKVGEIKPVTYEMANTRFINSGTVDSLNQMIRTVIINDRAAKAAYGVYENLVVQAEKKSTRHMNKIIKNTETSIEEFENFMNATTIGTGKDKSVVFEWNKSYEFLTAENGRALDAFIAGSKDPEEAIKLVKRIVTEGYKRRTTVKIQGDKGEFTAIYPVPSTGNKQIRSDSTTLTISDRMISEMERIPNILTHKDYGLFESIEHMHMVRDINLRVNKIAARDLGLTDADFTRASMAKINMGDIPTSGIGTNQGLANLLSFARRVVSPWYLGAVAWVRDLRVKNLNMFLAMARSPEMTKLMYAALEDPKLGKILSRTSWQGATGQKIAAALTNHWVDNEINHYITQKSPLNYIGIGNRVENLDKPENIYSEGIVIQKELKELFGIDDDSLEWKLQERKN